MPVVLRQRRRQKHVAVAVLANGRQHAVVAALEFCVKLVHVLLPQRVVQRVLVDRDGQWKQLLLLLVVAVVVLHAVLDKLVATLFL